MKNKLIIFLLIFSFSTFAKEIQIRGIVPRILNFKVDEGLSMASNGSMIVDIESSKGIIKRHYFQANSRATHDKRIKKITIYAP